MMTVMASEADPKTATRGALHVVHAVLNLDCGGLEHVVADLARTGRDAGHRVTVLCLERKGTLAGTLEELGITVLSLVKPAGLQMAAMRRALRPLLAKLRPDVVHSHQVGVLFYVAPAARAVGVPVVVHTEHGKHFGDRAKIRWLGRFAAWHSDRYFCVSRDIAEAVMRKKITSRRKVAVVPNGIDTAKFGSGGDAATVRREFDIPADAPVIGTVGRLAEIKRQDLLIRAFAKLVAQMPAAHLLLVGEGPLRNDLEHLAAGLGVSGRVRFAGYREDRERLYHAMNVFTLTSRSEGMPLSVLEAWAAGVPVVAACVGGLPELIDDDVTGVLVGGADPQQWASELRGMLRDPERSQRIVTAGRRRVEERHSLLSMQRHYESHYRDVLASRQV